MLYWVWVILSFSDINDIDDLSGLCVLTLLVTFSTFYTFEVWGVLGTPRRSSRRSCWGLGLLRMSLLVIIGTWEGPYTWCVATASRQTELTVLFCTTFTRGEYICIVYVIHISYTRIVCMCSTPILARVYWGALCSTCVYVMRACITYMYLMCT